MIRTYFIYLRLLFIKESMAQPPKETISKDAFEVILVHGMFAIL